MRVQLGKSEEKRFVDLDTEVGTKEFLNYFGEKLSLKAKTYFIEGNNSEDNKHDLMEELIKALPRLKKRFGSQLYLSKKPVKTLRKIAKNIDSQPKGLWRATKGELVQFLKNTGYCDVLFTTYVWNHLNNQIRSWIKRQKAVRKAAVDFDIKSATTCPICINFAKPKIHNNNLVCVKCGAVIQSLFYRPVTLDGSPEKGSLYNVVSSKDGQFKSIDFAADLQTAAERLGGRKGTILTLLAQGKSYVEIGKRLGLCGQRVRVLTSELKNESIVRELLNKG